MMAKLSNKLGNFDWKMMRGTTLVSLALMMARVLGLLYGLILTRALSQADYGYVEYGLSLGAILAMLTQPFGQHVLARYIGMYVNDKTKLQEYLNTAWVILAALFIGTMALAFPILAISGKLDIGVVVVYLGTTVFYVYYGLARGYLSNERLMIAFLGSNAIQLVATIIVYKVLNVTDPLPALLIYGLSYLPMLWIMSRFMPLQLGFKLIMPRRDVVVDLLRFSAPIWIGHVCFIVFDSLPTLYLERFTGEEAVGAYGLARRLSMVFMFVSQALAAILLPRTAGMTGRAEQGKLLRNSTIAYLATSLIPLIGWIFLYNPVAEFVSGPQYRLDSAIYIMMALATVIMGVQGLYEAVLMGRGRADLAMGSRIIGTVVAIVIGLWLVPAYGMAGAAITIFIGSAITQVLFMLFIATGKADQTNIAGDVEGALENAESVVLR
ncbi:MAG: oligosaccharide flippase family protein [Anaerolineae bacterium]|nr:oligosaccharide flippase family protein [Anaerolineae bacterium]